MDSKSKLVIGATALSLFLAACGSTHSIKQEASFNSEGSVKQVLTEVPQWYLDHDVEKGLITNRDADQFIYGVGTAVSPDLQLAIEKAMLVAKADLADQMKGQMNKKAEMYITELGAEGNKQVATRVESTIVNLIKDTKVVGYEQFEKDVFITADQNYRIYVGLRWSHTDSNRLFAYIQDEINREIEMAADVDELAQSAVNDVLDMSAPVTGVEVN